MKTNWKTLTTLLMGLTLGILSGCASEQPVSTVDPPSESQLSLNEDADTLETPGLQGALTGVELRVGTSGLFAPFSYYDETGSTLIGYDLDFLHALQDLLGFTLADGSVQAMEYAALTTSLAEGRLDLVMAALCATDERRQVMHFSETYYDSGQSVAINVETSPSEITGPDSFVSGQYTVAVEKGTASHIYAQSHFPENCIQVHDAIITAYESLEQGMVDALIQDFPNLKYFMNTAENSRIAMIGPEFNQGQSPYAVAVSFDLSRRHPDIVELLNQAIDELTDQGAVGEINARWFD